MGFGRLCATTWIVVCVATGLTAQQDAGVIQFDTASIKESTDLGTGGNMRPMPDGGIRAMHMPVVALIQFAYELSGYQVVDLPDWARNTYYDVNAKPATPASRPDTRAMLQALLKDRFRLAVHHENRTVNGFTLVRARPNVLGPNIKPSTLDCETQSPTSNDCRQGMFTPGNLKAIGTRMPSFGRLLEAFMNGPVTDETAITGTVDIDLHWSNEITPSGDVPVLVTALQEQLGLKLERRRVEHDVLVIDHLEKATPN